MDNYCAPREDNVRYVPGYAPPEACGYNPWRGSAVPGQHGRAITRDGNCGVCGYARVFGTHCFLYEMCDRCHEEDPASRCPTHQAWVRQKAGESPSDAGAALAAMGFLSPEAPGG